MAEQRWQCARRQSHGAARRWTSGRAAVNNWNRICHGWFSGHSLSFCLSFSHTTTHIHTLFSKVLSEAQTNDQGDKDRKSQTESECQSSKTYRLMANVKIKPRQQVTSLENIPCLKKQLQNLQLHWDYDFWLRHHVVKKSAGFTFRSQEIFRFLWRKCNEIIKKSNSNNN